MIVYGIFTLNNLESYAKLELYQKIFLKRHPRFSVVKYFSYIAKNLVAINPEK